MDSFIENLKQQVQCMLCKDTMVEPKVLRCFHIYCKSCLKEHAQLDHQQENIFECPRCNSKTVMQDLNDVEDLQTSSVHSRILKVLQFVENRTICSVSSSHPEALWQCLDCDRSLCEECLGNHSEFIKNHRVVSLSDLKKEDVEQMLSRECPCEIHGGQEVEFYCQDCDMLICVVCLKGKKEHRCHRTISLQEFVTIKKDSLSKSLQQIYKVSTDEKEKKQQEEIALKVLRAGKKATDEIKKMAKKLIQEVMCNEQHLLNQVKNNTTKAEKKLRILRHSTQAHEFISNLIDVGTASDLVAIQERNNSHASIYDYESYPQDATGFVFDVNEELRKQLENFHLGLVRPFKKADLNQSTFKVDPDKLEVGKKTKLIIELKTLQGNVTDETQEDLTIKFTPEDYVEVREIQMTENGEIKVEFIPRVSDKLSVEVQGRWYHFCNSPIADVIIKSQQRELKESLNVGAKYFSGIAVNKANSKIAVADHVFDYVRVYNMKGDLLLTYGSHGSGQCHLKNPRGLAFLNETDLVIADNDNHRICIVNTATGQPVTVFGCHGNRDGQFNSPYDVYVDDASNIVVCDYNNNRVQVFTKDGNYLYQFQSPYPFSVVTHDGLFYVSDKKHSAIHVVKMKDNLPTTLLTIRREDCSALKSCWGLAMGNDGNLLVCDNGAGVIHKFTSDGRYVGRRSSQINHSPKRIAVLNGGRVICTTWKCGVDFTSFEQT